MDHLLTALGLFAGIGPAIDLSTLRGLLGVILGVGALIFFHEAGHFLAAKWRGVRVEVFSLGFGHRLVGFRRGDTDYRISALPLGGYVRMLGQADEDPLQPSTDLEDDFRNKKVWERFVILFAGPAANVALAAVGFILCFGIGVEFTAPEIGAIMPGSAASKANLRAGDIITRIDGKEILGWQDLQTLVALATDEIELEVLRDGTKHVTRARPFRGPNDTYARLGVSPAWVLQGLTKDSLLGALDLKGSTPGQRDRLVNISSVSSLCPLDKRMTERDLAKFLEKAEGRVALTFERVRYDLVSGLPLAKPELTRHEIDLKRKQEFSLGVEIPDVAWIREVKKGSAADKAGVRVGDRLLQLGETQLKHSNLLEAVRDTGARQGETPVKLLVEREEGGAKKTVELSVSLQLQNKEVVANALEGVRDPKQQFEIRRAVGNYLLGVAYRADVVGAAGALTPADPDEGPVELKPGDRLKSIWTSGGLWWSGETPFGSEQWLRSYVRDPSRRTFKISWIPKGSDEVHSQVVKAIPHPSATYPDLGMLQSTRKVIVHRGPLSAVALGMQQTVIQTKRIFLMLRSFLTGAVSPKELGGPIQIVNVAYAVATQDSLARLFHLLAILSVNLAVINILPIPVLDGGHIFFLAIEKLKGKPVSSDILIYAQWFGLLCILGLMALVFFNDIRRVLQ